MKALIYGSVLAILAACAHTGNQEREPASAHEDDMGEELFFGSVNGEAGNVVQDQFGDVKVIRCGKDKWKIYIDPNGCGQAMAKGHMGCSEMATINKGPYSQEFKRGNHYLTHIRSGEKVEIRSVGENKYEMNTNLRGKIQKVTLTRAEKPLEKRELKYDCAYMN